MYLTPMFRKKPRNNRCLIVRYFDGHRLVYMSDVIKLCGHYMKGSTELKPDWIFAWKYDNRSNHKLKVYTLSDKNANNGAGKAWKG